MQGQFNVIFPVVTIGNDTRVGTFVMIRSNALIGDGCTIGSYVDIEGDVVIMNHADAEGAITAPAH